MASVTSEVATHTSLLKGLRLTRRRTRADFGDSAAATDDAGFGDFGGTFFVP